MTSGDDLPGGPTVALLQELIRNACVNDGDPDSGHEHRSVATLERWFHGSGLSWEVLEPHPGRTSLVATLPGTDPAAPTLLLLSHLDVVPAGDGWRYDPFAGTLVDDVVWGRGALDMLYLTAAYATVIRDIASDGARPRGTLVFAALADEESGGALGARWIQDHRPELLAADAVLGETGGVPLVSDGRVRGVTVTVGEKGIAARRLIATGIPRHASTPFGADNAILTAAEAAIRIAAFAGRAEIDDLWPRYVAELDVPEALRAALLDPERIDAALPELGALSGLAHALTHTTYSPDLIGGGDKINVVPQHAYLDIDIRSLPGTGPAEIDAQLRSALGPLADRLEILPLGEDAPAGRSPLDSALYTALDAAVSATHPGARAVPVIAPGGSDGRYFRERDIPVYGFSVLSSRWDQADFRRLVHSTDERIDVESVALTVDALEGVVRAMLR